MIAPLPPTIQLRLQNQTNSNTVYAYITGHATDHNGDWFLLQANGLTPYYPVNPRHDQYPISQDCAIPLNAPGASPKLVTVPKLTSARIYFSITDKMTFLLNQTDTGKPALVEPSVSNTSDPNFNVQWDFCEFTYDDANLFCNITYVDFVCLPISLTLTDIIGHVQHVTGIPSDGFQQIANQLIAQSQADQKPWNQLLQPKTNDKNAIVRILQPKNKIIMDPTLFQGYFENYVEQVWQKYTPSQELSINTQNSAWGVLNGYVDTATDSFTFPSANAPNGKYTFARPSTADVFSCNTGPFALGNDEKGNIGARIAAGFNRTTIDQYNNQPVQPEPQFYYAKSPTNHYARIVHSVNVDKLGYAFPYDDVEASDQDNQSGSVSSKSPQAFTVTVGANPTTRSHTMHEL